MTRRVRSYWAKYSNNFGDILTPVILEHFGLQARWVKRGVPGKILAVGSIIEHMRQGDVVWGTGAIPPKNRAFLTPPPGVRILAVRGPLTRKLIEGDVPEVYGDPALLLPRIYTPQLTREFEVGVIPHEIEKDIPPVQDPKVLWISINAGMRPVIDAIARCQLVVSSSLHGIIAAEVYGIPAVWVRMTNRVNGGNYKYYDYYLSTGREPPPVAQWADGLAKVTANPALPPAFDTGLLVRAIQDYVKGL